jgi:hypothetical protein
MILQTGGLAFGEISTRSRLWSPANSRASSSFIIPACWPSAAMTRISLAVMVPLRRVSFFVAMGYFSSVPSNL